MKEDYITAEEFSELCQKGLAYEGYIVGVGYAFLNVTFGLEYLNPAITYVPTPNTGYSYSQYPIQRSYVCQYIDTSEDQIKKSLERKKNLNSSSVKEIQSKAKEWHTTQIGIEQTNIHMCNSIAKEDSSYAREQVEDIAKKVVEYNPIAQGALSYASAFSESFINGAEIRVNEIQNHSVMFEKRFQNGAYNRSMYNALVKGKCKVPAKASPKYSPDQRLEIAKSRRLEIEKGNVKTNGGNVSKTEFVYGKNVSRFTKVMKGAGVAGIGFQGLVSYLNIQQAIDTNDKRKGRIIVKSSVDFIVPIVCIAVGGPGAWIIGGTYFIVDMAGGWDSLMDHTYNLFNEE
ncbi:MAG: hypothetical protein KIH03_12875 [Paludibacteraceae bacterium]|nr:hypothetical protein [Paludibacteraceae bacterium]